MGEEIGTAGGICGPLNTFVGHFGAYYAPEYVANEPSDCEESNYLQTLEEADAWGAVNHPDKGGSRWKCWYPGDSAGIFDGINECFEGAVNYGNGPTIEDDFGDLAFHDRVFRHIEVVNSGDLPPLATLDQWDGLLQAGWEVSATGGSDGHVVRRSTLGTVEDGNEAKIGLVGRTYAYHDGSVNPGSDFVPTDFGDPIRSALRTGRTIASNGPLVIPQVNGGFPGDEALYTGNSLLLRVDWPSGLPSDDYVVLDEQMTPDGVVDPGADGITGPDDEVHTLAFPHVPERIVVVLGEINAPFGCADQERPCPDAIEYSTYIPTSADLQQGFAELEIAIDPGWDRMYLRTEAMFDEISSTNSNFRDDLEFGYAAFSSPIYLQRDVLPPPLPPDPGGATLQGLVTAVTPGGAFRVPGAAVAVCEVIQGCKAVVFTDALGQFEVSGLDEAFHFVEVQPPSGLGLQSGQSDFVFVSSAGSFVQVVLEPEVPLAPGTSIGPSQVRGDGVPSVTIGDLLTVTTQGCAGGVATVDVLQGDDFIREDVSLTETPLGSGFYEGLINPFAQPEVGFASVEINIDCPTPLPDENTEFTLYIDPSGVVIDTTGAPIEGAIVTLLRSSDIGGPFESVRDGSAIMSPSNRTNPDTTDSSGRFQWDVLAGFYKVRAESFGCVSPTDPLVKYVETTILEIPPPAVDLELVLDCTPPTTGDLEIINRIVGDPPEPPAVFNYSVECLTSGSPLTLGPFTINGAGRETITDLPIGAECTITQQSTPSGFTSLSGTAQVQDVLPGVTPAGFVNRWGTLLTVLDITVRAAEPAAEGLPVTISVSCDSGDQATLVVPVGGSGQVADIPEGAVCDVAQVDGGGTAPTDGIATLTVTVSSLAQPWFLNGIDEESATSVEDILNEVRAELQQLIDQDPGSDLADKLEDVVANIDTALEELAKDPADRQAAVGNIEGAAGDLEAAIDDDLFPNQATGVDLADRTVEAASKLARETIDDAIAGGGDQSKIDEASEKADEGDGLRADGKYKDAAAAFKDAVSLAESSLP